MEQIHLSLIVPSYNAEKFIAETVRCIIEHYAAKQYTVEVIFVEDGSNDNTYEILAPYNGYVKDNVSMRVLENEKNRGKGFSVKRGMLEGRGTHRIFNDCDLAYQLVYVDRILEALEQGAEVAIACRRHKDSICETKPEVFRQLYYRELQGVVFNYLLKLMGLTDRVDTQAGLKGFSGRALKIFERQVIDGFSFDVELLYLAEQMKLNIADVPVRYQFFHLESTIRGMQQARIMLRSVGVIKRTHGPK